MSSNHWAPPYPDAATDPFNTMLQPRPPNQEMMDGQLNRLLNRNEQLRAQAPVITPELMHEMESHRPHIASPPARWEWMAAWINNAIANPNRPCPCCGVTPYGADMSDVACQELPRED